MVCLKKNYRRWLMVIVTLAVNQWALANAPTGVNLAAMTEWNIVVGKDAIASEHYAAEEFQKIFARSSGVLLPIVTSTERPDRHIFIGPGESLRASPVGFDVNDFGSEDLRIVIRNNNIAIAGGRTRGTLYGVYTFLEDYLGVRFLTFDHTHVPPVGDWRVIGPVDRFYHPPLSFRWSCFIENSREPDFAARLRCNTVTRDKGGEEPAISHVTGEPIKYAGAKLGGITGIVLFNHSFTRQLPWATYRADHPEYWSIRDGKRPTKLREAEQCFTHPEVAAIIGQAVMKELDDHPGQESVAVSQDDWGSACLCTKCSVIHEKEESGMGTLLTMVNGFADRVAEKYPKVKLGTLAYYHTQKPPKTFKPRPNVIIQLTSHDCSVTDPFRDSTYEDTVIFRNDLEGWGRICNHINLWYYNNNFATFSIPMPNIRVLEPNIRFFVANNIKGIFMQGAHNGPGADLCDLRNYVTSRLLWDPAQSGQELVDEFLDLHYRSAAGPIRRFINLIHNSAEAKGVQETWSGRPEHYGIDQPIIAAGLRAYKEAMELADDDVVRMRVEKASIGIYLAAAEEALTWAWYGPNTRPTAGKDGPVPPDVANRTRPYFRKYFALCKKYGVTMWNEQESMEHMSEFLKGGFGMSSDEPW